MTRSALFAVLAAARYAGLRDAREGVAAALQELREKAALKALDVDIVIPVGMQEDAGLIKEGQPRVERDRESGELMYTLRSIAKNAPWVRTIHLLVNGKHAVPDFVPEPAKTVMVDRCELLAECPTRNTFAVETIVDQVPGLAEHFIYTDDDDLLLQSATEADFFDDGRPRYWKQPGTLEGMYNSPASTQLPDGAVPQTMCRGVPPSCAMHVWVPLTRTIVQEVRAAYPDWFKFVQSHKEGRYSSKLNEFGTQAADEANSLEEASIPYIYWPRMRDEGTGVYSFSSRVQGDQRIGEYTEAAWRKLEAHPPFFQNINDDMPADQAGYEAARKVMVDTLERLLPDPHASASALELTRRLRDPPRVHSLGVSG